MEDNSALNIFPKTHLKPYDGMSVTAEAWAQAHDEHRRARQAHDLFLHGSGIVWGLEVTANDPPDQYVFISPGVAIDPAGNVIVVNEPVAYDFGTTGEGLLYLLLGYGERESGGVESEIKQVHHEFVIAARSSLPKRPAVELARVFLGKVGQPVARAKVPAHPMVGELDLRFRAQVAPRVRRPAYVGLAYFGRNPISALAGWDFLAAECARAGYPLIVDDSIALTEMAKYDFVYASGRGAFSLSAAQQQALKAYFESGHTLFAEALDSAADSAFRDLFSALGCALKPLEADARLLQHPFLFAAPPPGGLEGGLVQTSGQVIYSTFAYSQAWGGKFSNPNPSRADIRAAHEWGVNLVAHILGQPSG